MALFSWLFHRERPAPQRLRDLSARVDDVEADLDSLKSQLKKLRGLVTGGIRRQDESENAPAPAGPTISPEPDQHAREIENGRLLVALRGQRGILPR